jgi:hypothetical protein
MCDSVMLLDGTEVWSVGGLRTKDFDVPSEVGERECLCRVDLEAILAADGRRFKRGYFGMCEWSEQDAEGRTHWEDAYDYVEKGEAFYEMVKRPDWPHGFNHGTRL